ncbi:signal peptidase II [bacterium]|nr:signal peptidase II [bacterium]
MNSKGIAKFLSISLIVFVLDQITKFIAINSLKGNPPIEIFGEYFRLTYVENPGIAFGITINGGSVIFTVLAVFIAFAILYYLFQLSKHENFILPKIAYSLILGGAFGNILDRMLYGKVVDFFDSEFPDIVIPAFSLLGFDFNGYDLYRWPVFNIADSAVCVGIVILFFAISKEDPSELSTKP